MYYIRLLIYFHWEICTARQFLMSSCKRYKCKCQNKRFVLFLLQNKASQLKLELVLRWNYNLVRIIFSSELLRIPIIYVIISMRYYWSIMLILKRWLNYTEYNVTLLRYTNVTYEPEQWDWAGLFVHSFSFSFECLQDRAIRIYYAMPYSKSTPSDKPGPVKNAALPA